mmetsp:Transcript_23381/g.57944  ORF Transcript_23381/g.57944 Transcript_23381/m.57944 type:complete len:300 (-) Transcript_23381:2021-2920(-)
MCWVRSASVSSSFLRVEACSSSSCPRLASILRQFCSASYTRPSASVNCCERDSSPLSVTSTRLRSAASDFVSRSMSPLAILSSALASAFSLTAAARAFDTLMRSFSACCSFLSSASRSFCTFLCAASKVANSFFSALYFSMSGSMSCALFLSSARSPSRRWILASAAAAASTLVCIVSWSIRSVSLNCCSLAFAFSFDAFRSSSRLRLNSTSLSRSALAFFSWRPKSSAATCARAIPSMATSRRSTAEILTTLCPSTSSSSASSRSCDICHSRLALSAATASSSLLLVMFARLLTEAAS